MRGIAFSSCRGGKVADSITHDRPCVVGRKATLSPAPRAVRPAGTLAAGAITTRYGEGAMNVSSPLPRPPRVGRRERTTRPSPAGPAPPRAGLPQYTGPTKERRHEDEYN